MKRSYAFAVVALISALTLGAPALSFEPLEGQEKAVSGLVAGSMVEISFFAARP